MMYIRYLTKENSEFFPVISIFLEYLIHEFCLRITSVIGYGRKEIRAFTDFLSLSS